MSEEGQEDSVVLKWREGRGGRRAGEEQSCQLEGHSRTSIFSQRVENTFRVGAEEFCVKSPSGCYLNELSCQGRFLSDI